MFSKLYCVGGLLEEQDKEAEAYYTNNYSLSCY